MNKFNKKYLTTRYYQILNKAANDDSYILGLFGYVFVPFVAAIFFVRKYYYGNCPDFQKFSFYNAPLKDVYYLDYKVNPDDHRVYYTGRFISDPMSKMRILPKRPHKVFKDEETLNRVCYSRNLNNLDAFFNQEKVFLRD